MRVMKIKKLKGQNKCVIRRKLMFENYRTCLEETKLENKTSHLEKKWNLQRGLKKGHKEFIKKQYINIKNTAKI